jgi:secreted trypsin-like serine protease
METIARWGATSEGGDTPGTLQEAQVPITTDAACAAAYSDFDTTTMVCTGYPQGGTDTCQGDSGGPLFGHTAAGELEVVGATSFGEGCARAGQPARQPARVYARRRRHPSARVDPRAGAGGRGLTRMGGRGHG